MVIPLLVARITTGAALLYSALFKKEKHSISSICTSSMKRTPGTISAFPSYLHSDTFLSICSLTYWVISPVAPENKAKNPCDLEFITSISWRVTVWTTYFLFSIYPYGQFTNLAWGPIASYSDARAKLRPDFDILPEALSIVITSPEIIFYFWIDSIIFCPKS